MSDHTPDRHDADARPDEAPPTDAVTDEVRQDAASAEDHADVPEESPSAAGAAEAVADTADQGGA